MNVQLLNKKDGIMICYVYAKFKGNKNFKAFDIKNGREAGNLIYSTIVEDSPITRERLQRLADLNKKYSFIFQLRRNNRIYFQTK